MMAPTVTASLLASLALLDVARFAAAKSTTTYVVPADFPSSIFPSYYRHAEPTREPQPAVYDPVYKLTYPLNLTDPKHIPQHNDDPVILPKPIGEVSPHQAEKYMKEAIKQIQEIVNGSAIQGACSKCVASLNVMKNLAMVVPHKAPLAMTTLCTSLNFQDPATCLEDFGSHNFGAIWTQVMALSDVSGLDGQYICYYLDSSSCPKPAAFPPVNTTGLFPKPKPANAKAPAPSGKRVKVLHMSDFHLDPRFGVGSEANCTSSLCCRFNNPNTEIPSGQISLEAPLYGSYKCDTPYFLGAGALQASHPLTGTDKPGSALGWTIYTGDLVSHDSQTELSRAYVSYEEASIYNMLHKLIKGPIFAVLGNHDTNPEAQDAPHSLPGPLGQQFSWNYDHVAGLWLKDGFIPASAAKQARLHYGGYSVKNQYGLRLITLNTDFWYHSNMLNYIHAANPDVSSMQHWLIDELQAAEDAGERVWILGHVLTGWDGSNPLPNPTDLFYAIVERYSPHVIANLFFGHTHEDQVMIYYARNGTTRNDPRAGAADALATGWVGPSVTPLTNLNSGFRMYEVDDASFDILDAYTYYAEVNSFPALPTAKHGPTFKFEYSTREAYGPAAKWAPGAPLNASFWHAVTEALERQAHAGDLTLTELFNTYQGKSSVQSPACNTTACALAKVCYMRSGSAALGRECPQGYGSVQSPFTPS